MANDALERFRARLDEVIEKSREVAATERQSNSRGMPAYLDTGAFTAWRMSALTVLKQLAPSTHFESEWTKAENMGGSGPYQLKMMVAVLEALRTDFDGGYLANVRGLLRGEVFADFVEQAQHLFKEGYWQPAAVIIGAVLEDHLRKLCAKYPAITLPANPKLDGMNAELAKAGQYDKLVQKQVTVWADVRNKAAHGEWSAFKQADVQDMIRGVVRFLDEQRA